MRKIIKQVRLFLNGNKAHEFLKNIKQTSYKQTYYKENLIITKALLRELKNHPKCLCTFKSSYLIDV